MKRDPTLPDSAKVSWQMRRHNRWKSSAEGPLNHDTTQRSLMDLRDVVFAVSCGKGPQLEITT